jgi:hypothetical protein
MNIINQAPVVIISRTEQDPFPLPAPDVAVAFHDEDSLGLIPVSELSAPLTADFKVWDAAEEGYTYKLYWDGTSTGPEKVILATDKPGDPLTLEIPVELLTEGFHSLAYRTYSPDADSENFSDVFPIIIDITAPGKPDLAAIQFPVEVQNGLTAAELEQLGGKLGVEIAGYTGMAKHDVITTYWGDVEGPTTIVSEDDMGLNKVLFDFSRDFLESIPSGPQRVKYQVTDRAGNISDESITVEILLLLEEIPENYPAPMLDPSIGTLIDYAEARPGVQVDIPHYPGASAFDQITLYWGADLQMLPVQLPPGNENEDIVLSLRVPYDTIATMPIGSVSISYTVTRQNQLNGTSLPTTVDVFLTLPIPEPTFAPTVQGTSVENPNTDDNFIDEDDYELNARAVVEWSNAFQVNDDINLFWGDEQRLQWRQINEADMAAQRNLIIPIANSIMKTQGTGAEIPVRYTVVRQGNPNASSSPSQKVTVRSKEDLPGGPEGINGPVFKLNPAGFISQSVAPDGTDGKIDPYANIAEGQRLFFSFKGFDRDNNPIEAATYTGTRVLDDQDIINGYSFHVPYITLRTICRGFCEAYIRVEPAPGSNQSSVTSRTTRVPVEMRQSSEPVCPI